MPHKLELVLYLFCLFKPRASIAHCSMWPLLYLPELRWRTHSNESTLSFVSLWHYSCHAAVQLTLRCRSMILILLLHVYITRQFYCQIPVLANSTPVAGTDKFQYLQIPSLFRLPTHSTTCKFHPCCLYWQIHYLQFPCWEKKFVLLPNSSTCKFLSSVFTVRIQYLQFPLPANSYNPSEPVSRLTTWCSPHSQLRGQHHTLIPAVA